MIRHSSNLSRSGASDKPGAVQKEEAEILRNKLLMYRFRRFKKINPRPEILDRSVEPRINQVYSPLSAVMEDEAARADLRAIARQGAAVLKSDRSASMDAQVLTVIRHLLEASKRASIGIAEITELFCRAYGKDYERQVTNRWIGHVVRRKLNLLTHKSHGVFVVPVSERPKLEALFDRYGVTSEDARSLAGQSPDISELLRPERVDLGDLGDIGAAPGA